MCIMPFHTQELEAIADGDGDDQVAQDESNGDFTDVLPLEKHLDLVKLSCNTNA